MTTCTYCDQPATTRDHVPPKCVSPGNTKTVPACHRCNVKVLGGRPLVTVEERYAFVQAYLWRQHEKREARARRPFRSAACRWK